MENAMHSFNTSPLISCELLLPQLSSSNLKIFDVRGGWGSGISTAKAEYQRAHIPGASLIDWRHDFIQTNAPINLASVANRDQAEDAFMRLGINRRDTVVLYDDYHHMQAGRVWWAMRYWGFINVKVLNGGWKRWVDLGLETSADIPTASKGSFKPEEKPRHIVSLDTLVSILDEVLLLDARGSSGYAGDKNDPRSGHIPSAINIPYSLMLESDVGIFKSESELCEIFSGQAPGLFERNIVSSCGSGYAGTVLLLALAHIGVHAPLFDGSFAVWKQDERRPVEQFIG